MSALTPAGSTSSSPPTAALQPAPPLTREEQMAVVVSNLGGHPVAPEEIQVQFRKEQIRRELMKKMLEQLELPENTPWTGVRQAWTQSTNHMQFKMVMQCLLLAFFDDLGQQCQLPVDAIKKIMGFLKFVQNTPFAKDNNRRLMDVMEYLRKFPRVEACLAEDSAKNFLQAMKIFLTATEIERRTLGAVRDPVRNQETAAEKKPLEICRYVGHHVQIILQRTFAIMDAEIRMIKEKFDPVNAKKEFSALFSMAARLHLPPAYREIFHQNMQFYERMLRMLRVYQARKKFLGEQYKEMVLLLEDTPSMINALLFSLVGRFSNDLSQLSRQIDVLKQTCQERLDQFTPCLSRESIEEIERSENRHVFIPKLSSEEEKEESAASASQLGEMVSGMLKNAPKMTSSITPEESIEFLGKMADLNQKFGLVTRMINEIGEGAVRIQQSKERAEKVQREQFEKKKKQMPEAHVQQIEKNIALNYRLVFQLSSVIGSFQDSLGVLKNLLQILEDQAKALVPPEPLPVSSALAPLFRKPKGHRTRPAERWTIPQLSPASLKPAAEAAAAPLPARMPETPPSEEKKPALQDPFTLQQARLQSPLLLQLYSNTHSLQSLEHTRLQLGNLRSATHFLTMHQGPLPLAIIHEVVRSCSLTIEQALTARAFSEGVEISHDHVELSQQLKLPPLPIFEELRYGVVFHRYPWTSELFLRQHGFRLPLTLKWLLNPEMVASEDLMGLMAKTFAALQVIFPQQKEVLLEEFNSRETTTPKSHPFSSRFTESLETPRLAFERCIKEIEAIDALDDGNNELRPLKKAICGDIRFSLQCLCSALDSLAAFPHTAALAALGDSSLTLIQFLDEHIEKLWHLHSFNQIRISHDLEDYRASRDYLEKPEHQQILTQINIGYGAQYPHRYRQETGTTPGAIQWRLEVERMSLRGETIDKEAVQAQEAQKAGYNLVKRKTKQTPVFTTQDQLFTFIRAEAEMAEKRLKDLHKETRSKKIKSQQPE